MKNWWGDALEQIEPRGILNQGPCAGRLGGICFKIYHKVQPLIFL